MRRIARLLAQLAGAAAAIVALVSPAAAQISCPGELVVEQRAKSPSGEWTVGTSGYRALLAGVSIYDGPPEKHVSLKPEQQSAKDEWKQAWDLPAGREYWLSCEYTNTNLVISRPLPRDIRRCEAVIMRGVTSTDTRPPVKSVSCRGDPGTRSREGATIHRGTVTLGTRERVFVPCGAKARYWLVDQTPDNDLENLYARLAPQGDPLFVDVHGWIGPATEAAAAAKLEQTLTVSEVRRAAPSGTGCAEDPTRFEVRAVGADAAWAVDVSREGIRFRPEGGEEQAFPYASPQASGGGLLYAVKVEGPPPRAFGLLVRGERCVDPHTGAVYSLSAELGAAGEKFRGCAYAGEAARIRAMQRPAAPTTPAAAAAAASPEIAPKAGATKKTATKKKTRTGADATKR